MNPDTPDQQPLTPADLMADYGVAFLMRNGVGVYVPKADFRADAGTPTHVVVAGTCSVTDEMHIVENVPLAGLSAWHDDRRAIQDALPDVNRGDREFIRSGVSPAGIARMPGGAPR